MQFREGLIKKSLQKFFTILNRISHRLFGIIVSPVMYAIGRKRNKSVYNYDYFRFSSLELAADEINDKFDADDDLLGSVAELGVYRGGFSKCINELFPNRKLYLFDTFDGFDSRDTMTEEDKSYSNERDDFSDTSVEYVLNQMKYPDKCIIRKGFFPESTKGLEDEKYIFVSIDADLFDPIYFGLKYFYPRLLPGGYIFVHDYNNSAYAGAKEAVRKYSSEFNAPFFPLSDYIGSAVFMK